MVSMLTSPLIAGRLWWMLVGEPSGFLLGLSSKPLMEPDLLVGGEVPRPCEETGDLKGEELRFIFMLARVVRPASWIESRRSGGGLV